jgi:hypothetical protein
MPNEVADPACYDFGMNHPGVSVLLASLVSIAGCSHAARQIPDWFNNYDEARREARETHKPMLVEFRCEP